MASAGGRENGRMKKEQHHWIDRQRENTIRLWAMRERPPLKASGAGMGVHGCRRER